MVTMYSTGCPKCRVLATKLEKAGVEFAVVDDIDLMKERGIEEVPVLDIDGQLMSFIDAVRWVNESATDFDCPTCHV